MLQDRLAEFKGIATKLTCLCNADGQSEVGMRLSKFHLEALALVQSGLYVIKNISHSCFTLDISSYYVS